MNISNDHIQLFIHRENQIILWEIISKSSLWLPFKRALLRITPEQWFRNIVKEKYAYLQSSSVKIDPSKFNPVAWLRETNKETILQMVNSMNSWVYSGCDIIMNPNPSSYNGNPSVENSPIPTLAGSHSDLATYEKDTPTLIYSAPRNYDTPAISAFDVERERKEKQERAKRDFETYQSQYNSLLARPVPTSPVFSETLSNDKITNMDELLKHQQSLREKELAVAQSTYVAPSSDSPQLVSPENTNVDRDNIKMEVLNALLKNTPVESTTRKSVTWEQ
jgi:hypothetical protein